MLTFHRVASRYDLRNYTNRQFLQGVVTPIGAVVTAATGVKKWSRGQGMFLVSVKRSRTIFKLGNAVKMVAFLWPLASGTVNSVQCVWSNGQGPVCDAVKRSSNKNDGQNILTPVAAVTTAPMAVTTPCSAGVEAIVNHLLAL